MSTEVKYDESWYAGLVELRTKMLAHELDMQINELKDEFESFIEHLKNHNKFILEIFEKKIDLLERAGDPDDFNKEISRMLANVRSTGGGVCRSAYAALVGLSLRTLDKSLKAAVEESCGSYDK